MTPDTINALAPLNEIRDALCSVAAELRSLNDTLRTEADSDALWALLRSGDIRRVAGELRRMDDGAPIPQTPEPVRDTSDGFAVIF